MQSSFFTKRIDCRQRKLISNEILFLLVHSVYDETHQSKLSSLHQCKSCALQQKICCTRNAVSNAMALGTGKRLALLSFSISEEDGNRWKCSSCGRNAVQRSGNFNLCAHINAHHCKKMRTVRRSPRRRHSK